MEFSKWAEEYYRKENPMDKNPKPDKDYRDGLKDRIKKRLTLVLMLHDEWEDVIWDEDSGKKKTTPKYMRCYINGRYLSDEEIEEQRKEVSQRNSNIRKAEVKKLKRSLYRWMTAHERDRDYELKKVVSTIIEGRKAVHESFKEEMDNREKIDLFQDVTEVEGKFYQKLLEFIPYKADTLFQQLKQGKWWVLPIESRKEILEYLIQLMDFDKWNFLWHIRLEIATKLIYPYKYKLDNSLGRMYNVIADIHEFGYGCSGCEDLAYDEELENKLNLRIIEIAEEVDELTKQLENLLEDNDMDSGVLGEEPDSLNKVPDIEKEKYKWTKLLEEFGKDIDSNPDLSYEAEGLLKMFDEFYSKRKSLVSDSPEKVSDELSKGLKSPVEKNLEELHSLYFGTKI